MRRKLLRAIAHVKHQTLGLPRLKVRPSDCFLSSWPRSGNTWMRYLLFDALYPKGEWDLPRIDLAMPILDRVDLPKLLPALDEQPVRMFKSHQPLEEYLLAGKTVYLIRNGRDSILSLYHYRRQMDRLRAPLSQFLAQTLAGELAYGPWHSHVESYLARPQDEHLLILRYEDMLKDAGGQLRQVLDFFGLTVPAGGVEYAVERATVGRVDEGFRKYAQSRQREFQSGLTGSGKKEKEQFSPGDEELFQRFCGETMRKLGYS